MPEQVTLVPDAIGAITLRLVDTVQNQAYLTDDSRVST
jgi:hypothetical protein